MFDVSVSVSVSVTVSVSLCLCACVLKYVENIHEIYRNTVEDIFEEFGFSELANGAAKSSVHFRAPQMPRNKEGELP